MKFSLPHLNQQTFRHPRSCPIFAYRDTLEPCCQTRYTSSALASGLIRLLANAATHNKHGLCISVAVIEPFFFSKIPHRYSRKKNKQTTEKEKKHPLKTSCWEGDLQTRSTELHYCVMDDSPPSRPFPDHRAERLVPLTRGKVGTI